MEPTEPSFVRRAAVGLWLCAVAALGGLRVAAKLARDAEALAAFDTRVWIVASAVTALLGLALVVRELRR